MKGTGVSLGPLERDGGRWRVGNDRGRYGYWVEFREDGLYQYAPRRGGSGNRAGGEAPDVVPWSRIMSFGQFTLGAKYPRGNFGLRGWLGGLRGPWLGSGPGYLHMTLRHPYEDWLARFDRHPRPYSGCQLFLFQELLRQTVRLGQAHRLGDPEWLDRVVTRLAPLRPRGYRGFEKAVTAALEEGAGK